jgi:hypothetical protein
LFAETAFNLSALAQADFGQDCLRFASLWAHSRSSTSSNSNMQDYIGPRPLAARSCAASGTKFSDDNANGVRDAGEPGLPRFVVWADYNGDGRPPSERTVHSDR